MFGSGDEQDAVAATAALGGKFDDVAGEGEFVGLIELEQMAARFSVRKVSEKRRH